MTALVDRREFAGQIADLSSEVRGVRRSGVLRERRRRSKSTFLSALERMHPAFRPQRASARFASRACRTSFRSRPSATRNGCRPFGPASPASSWRAARTSSTERSTSTKPCKLARSLMPRHSRKPASAPAMTAGGRMKASLSLDLDNKWSYMKTHGDAAWQSFPSYLDAARAARSRHPRTRCGLRITFFIVGQDAALPEHADVLAEILAARARDRQPLAPPRAVDAPARRRPRSKTSWRRAEESDRTRDRRAPARLSRTGVHAFGIDSGNARATRL